MASNSACYLVID
jgi:GntR family transcriptional regulator, vanillate catabolism transcriptional regulator